MTRFKDLVLHCWRSFREILIRTCFKWSNIQFKSRTIRNGALNISSVGKRRNRIWTSVWDLSVLVYVTADELFTCQSLTRSIFHPKMIIQATDIWNWRREHRTNVHFRVGKIFNIDISTELKSKSLDLWMHWQLGPLLLYSSRDRAQTQKTNLRYRSQFYCTIE